MMARFEKAMLLLSREFEACTRFDGSAVASLSLNCAPNRGK